MIPFAFFVHPDGKSDVVRKYSWARYLPASAIELLMRLKKPSVLGEITGIRTPQGLETHGWLIGIPRTTRQFLRLPDGELVDMLLQGDRVAAAEGAKVGGCGAYTAMPGQGGKLLNNQSLIPWTSGNTNTTARAIAATRQAMGDVAPDFDYRSQGILAVVGATGAIGEACARILAPEFREIILIGRDLERTEAVKEAIGNQAVYTQDVCSVRRAHVVLTATNSADDVIKRPHLTPGTIVVDVARPRDVSARLAHVEDILVIEGGIVRAPGPMRSTFRFGLGDREVFACQEETILLSLEGRAEPYTIGKGITLDRIKEMTALGHKHGFSLAGFRTFDRPITPEHLERVKHAAAERVRSLVSR